MALSKISDFTQLFKPKEAKSKGNTVANADGIEDESRRKFLKKATKTGAIIAVGGLAVLETACDPNDLGPAPQGTAPTAPIVPTTPSNSEQTEAALRALAAAGIQVTPASPAPKMRVLSNVAETLSVQIDELPAGSTVKGTLSGVTKNLNLYIPNLHNTAVIDLAGGVKQTVSATTLTVDAAGTPGLIKVADRGEIFINGSIENGANRNAPSSSNTASMTMTAPGGFVQFATADGLNAIANRAGNSAFKITTARFRTGIVEQSIGFDVTASDLTSVDGNLFHFGTLPSNSRATYNASTALPATATVELGRINDGSSLTLNGAEIAPLKVTNIFNSGLQSNVKATMKNVNATLDGLGDGTTLTIDNTKLPSSTTSINRSLGSNVNLTIQNAPEANATVNFSADAMIGANNNITLLNSARNNLPGAAKGTSFTIDNTKLTRASQTNFSKQFDGNVTLKATAAPNLDATITFGAEATIGANSTLALTNLAPTFNAAIASGSTVTVDATANDKLITANFKQLIGALPRNSNNPLDYEKVPVAHVTLKNAHSNFSNLGDRVTLDVSSKENTYPLTTVKGSYIGAYSEITVDQGQTKLDVDTVGFNASHNIKGYLVECAVKAAPLYHLNYQCTEDPAKKLTLGITSLADGLNADKRNIIISNLPILIGSTVGQFSTIQAPSLDAKRIADNVIVRAKGDNAYVRAESNGTNNEFRVDGPGASIGIRTPSNGDGRYFLNGIQVNDLKQITQKDYSLPIKTSVCLG